MDAINRTAAAQRGPGRDVRRVRVDFPAGDRLEYAASADDERYRLAATARATIGVVRRLVERHEGERMLIIGQNLDQIDTLSEALNAPRSPGRPCRRRRLRPVLLGAASLLPVPARS